MAAAALPSILLILSVAFTAATIATAHHPPSSDKTRLLKACRVALGPGGASLVRFCANDFLGHRAAFLAGCGTREAVAVVLEESYEKAVTFEDFEKRISNESSLCKEELRELRRCWGLMNNVVGSVGDVYANVAVKKLSIGVVVKGTSEKVAEAKRKCGFSAAGRRRGVWSELQVKAKESVKAEIVALAFMNRFHSILN